MERVVALQEKCRAHGWALLSSEVPSPRRSEIFRMIISFRSVVAFPFLRLGKTEEG
jgi:hypothetical protein